MFFASWIIFDPLLLFLRPSALCCPATLDPLLSRILSSSSSALSSFPPPASWSPVILHYLPLFIKIPFACSPHCLSIGPLSTCRHKYLFIPIVTLFSCISVILKIIHLLTTFFLNNVLSFNTMLMFSRRCKAAICDNTLSVSKFCSRLNCR